MAQENPMLSATDMAEYQAFLDYAKEIYDYTEVGYFDKGLDSTMEILKRTWCDQSVERI